VTIVSAQFVDIPLEVLPGRSREFSNFVSKVLFSSDGALAGVQGVAAVNVHIDGLPIIGGPKEGPDGEQGDLALSGLPFQGSVRISKRGL